MDLSHIVTFSQIYFLPATSTCTARLVKLLQTDR